MKNDSASTTGKKHRLALILIVSMFALWGLAHRLYDTLRPEFASALALNSFQSDLAQWALSIAYFIMPLPAALVTRNFGYKSGVIFGLGCFAVGLFLFFPAADQLSYPILLGAALVTGSGLCILEVAADPLIVRLGPVESAVRRLNLAQALNPLGVLVGLVVGGWIIQTVAQAPHGQTVHALVTPYLVIGAGVMLFAFIVEQVEFPPVASERVTMNDSTLKSFSKVLSLRMFRYGMAAQALCSVAQVLLWGFTVRYAENAMPGLSDAGAMDILLWSLIAFTVGRVAGTALMYRFDPSHVLTVFSGAAALAAAFAAVTGNEAGVYGIVAASFFLSITFPTIFGSTIRDLGPLTKSGAALLMLAAGSGAAVFALANLTVSKAAVQYVMLLPSLSFALIAVFAVYFRRAAGTERKAAAGSGTVPAAVPLAK